MADHGGTTRWHQIAGRWLEPWFSAYALAGLLVNALVPILIPVTVEPKGPVAVAIVISAFFVGQLTAPFIGSLADRTNTQRQVFLGSFPIMAAAAVAFGLSHSVVLWVLAALVAGAAAGAAQTTGSVFIVEGHPRSEWDMRIGWFRLTFGAGQVAGLAIGAVFADHHADTGWFVGAAAILCGVFLGRLGLPHLVAARESGAPTAKDPVLRAHPVHSATAGPAAPVPARHHRGHDEPAVQQGELSRELKGPFGIFLLTWLLAMIAVQTILNVMPLIMKHAFEVPPSKTTTYYLVGSVIGALLYPVCGALAAKIGSGRVLAIGMLITLTAFVMMAAAWLFDLPGGHIIGPCALIVVAIGYPFDYVGGTMLAAELTLDGQGSAMGLFNSAVAAGAIVGAVVPSFLAVRFGYGSLPPLAAVIMAAAFVVGIRIFRGRPSAPAPSVRP